MFRMLINGARRIFMPTLSVGTWGLILMLFVPVVAWCFYAENKEKQSNNK